MHCVCVVMSSACLVCLIVCAACTLANVIGVFCVMCVVCENCVPLGSAMFVVYVVSYVVLFAC